MIEIQSIDNPPDEAKLTAEEIKLSTPSPDATDPWSVLASEAPLTSTVIGGQHLRSVLRYANETDWPARKAAIREAILNGAHLNPLPPKTPLYAKKNFGQYPLNIFCL